MADKRMQAALSAIAVGRIVGVWECCCGTIGHPVSTVVSVKHYDFPCPDKCETHHWSASMRHADKNGGGGGAKSDYSASLSFVMTQDEIESVITNLS